MIEFRVLKQSRKSSARLGILQTSHGEVMTPALVPVATQAVVKTLTSEEAAATGTTLLIANTFHLHLKPGEAIVKRAGGLHTFMHWQKPLMTDSGGYQVFSLGFGKDFGTGKILKTNRSDSIPKDGKPQSLTITENGVWFRSPSDGQKIFLGPRESIRIQEKLGADIMVAFDECTSPLADYAYTKKSLLKTHRWAALCLEARTTRQALYGVVQGGRYKDLRLQSAHVIGSLPFDGFAIGGEFGKGKQEMARMLAWVYGALPYAQPRHLLGIGHPEDIVPIIKAGTDTFDCSAPTHYARHGVAFTSGGRLTIEKQIFLKDQKPLDLRCACEVCGSYSRSYIAHLMRAKEITALRLLTFHNLFFFHTLVEKVRNGIKAGKI